MQHFKNKHYTKNYCEKQHYMLYAYLLQAVAIRWHQGDHNFESLIKNELSHQSCITLG